MPVIIPDSNTNPEPTPNNDGTPTAGYSFATSSTNSAGTVKVTGSSGNDVITISDLQKDTDQVILTGLGNDLFRWNGSEGARAGAPGGTEDVNGIVKFGGAGTGGPDNDVVFLANQLSDYEFSLRADGGIKIHYIGTTDGAAVTFYGAETFTFRNITDTASPAGAAGTNLDTFDLTAAELIALINSGTLV